MRAFFYFVEVLVAMNSMMPSNDNNSSMSGWTLRKASLFLLSMSPLIALLALLAWGQLRTGGNPGGLLEYSDSGEQMVTNRPAPEFSGVNVIDGSLIENATMNGKIVMVDFWSSWCVACRAEAANLATLYEEYADSSVEFLGIAIWDQSSDILRHVDRYGISYPNIIDEQGMTAVLYGVRGVPEKFFLDGSGNIVRKLTGPVTPERMRGILDAMLAL